MKGITAGFVVLAALAGAACSKHSATPTGPSTSGGSSYSAVNPLAASTVHAGTRQGFGFNGTVRGFPHGAVFLTGGGSFDAATASNIVPTETTAKSGGGFGCVDAVTQGPLTGCGTGEGVRWDVAQLLASTTFKCSAADVAKPAATGPGTVVFLADFYRAGDGIDESFKAQMIVSDSDLAPLIPGNQNLWVQGVGCGDAVVNFSR